MADRALKEVNGFNLFGQKIVSVFLAFLPLMIFLFGACGIPNLSNRIFNMRGR